MQRHLRALVGIILGLLIGLAAYYAYRSPENPQADTMTINGATVRLEIADTDTERAQGLSGHAPLAGDEGMLFVFPQDGIYSFWMKDMLFPIDILWLDAAGTVVHVERDVAPESYPGTFTSGSPARYVLEVRAGFATEHEIGVGSKSADFPL